MFAFDEKKMLVQFWPTGEKNCSYRGRPMSRARALNFFMGAIENTAASHPQSYSS